METTDWIALVGVGVALIGLSLGMYKAISAVRRRKRQAVSALTGELYPVLRNLRDGSLAFIKPLGGGDRAKVIELHASLLDLVDLEPAVLDEELHRLVRELLQQPAASMVASIDPNRFQGLHLTQPGLDDFRAFAELADSAVERCQVLRRGAT